MSKKGKKGKKAIEKKTEPKVYCKYTRMVKTGELKPNPRNPNRHPQNQIELLAKIINKQGWRAPITVSTRSGFVVRGHGRLQAAMMLGWKRCPVDFQNYDNDSSEKADMVADNRLSELSSMNIYDLQDLLKEVKSEDFDIDLTGFIGKDLETVLSITDKLAVACIVS